jgi:hypothetical protein
MLFLQRLQSAKQRAHAGQLARITGQVVEFLGIFVKIVK